MDHVLPTDLPVGLAIADGAYYKIAWQEHRGVVIANILNRWNSLGRTVSLLDFGLTPRDGTRTQQRVAPSMKAWLSRQR